jgi:hypothetical protein
MPCLEDVGFILDNYPTDLIELARAEASIPGQTNWIDPELGLVSFAPNVHVRRFRAVEAVEKQPIRPRNIPDPRHDVPDDGLIVVGLAPSPANARGSAAARPRF